MFAGRRFELTQLQNLLKKQSASLVVLRGRRRIGKSRLVEEFAKNSTFIQIAGVAPTANTTRESQLDQFLAQLRLYFDPKKEHFATWSEAFHLLAQHGQQGRVVILLDEISWMGSQDDDFLGQLKNAWDHEFSKNSQLILVLCGSVSTWIKNEIINSTLFLGRLAFNLMLQELNLKEAWLFFHTDYLSSFEKLKILSVTGGVPRYLELVNPSISAEANIKNLLFVPNAPLLYEYDRIFNDIFGKKSGIYRNIIECLVSGAKTQADILDTIKRAKSGDLSFYLEDLIECGFIHRDFTGNIRTEKISNKSKYRLKDNFLRFYLKFVANYVLQIEAGFYEKSDISALPEWNAFLGLQFENLVLNNIKLVMEKLNIDPLSIVFFGPYFQGKTNKAPGCQIDLLLQTRTKILYVCEIKFSKYAVGLEVINQVKEKIKHMTVPKNFSIIPVLIHANGISESLEDTQFFPYILNITDLTL
ncbi:MAG: ATP-binding protein [Gammaproteobacteria bacterium]|nr:ATP-binding protein [Gammaproteobacteria bacterium]